MIKLTIKVWLSELNQKRWLLLTKSYRKIQKKTKVEEVKKIRKTQIPNKEEMQANLRKKLLHNRSKLIYKLRRQKRKRIRKIKINSKIIILLR